MKILKKVLIGCLGLFVLGLLILAITAGVMVTLGPPETRPEESDREVAVDLERLPPAPDPAPGEVPLPARTLAVLLDLEEGEFDIRPGEPGEGIRVEARYDAGLYSLEQSVEGERAVVRFRSKYSMLRRLLTLGAVEPKNRITVFLPPDVPLSLQMRCSKGETSVDLSGLALVRLDADLSMGEFELGSEQPNPLRMQEARIRMSMGEFRSRELGNLRFERLRLDGSMGEVGLDLTGDYAGDAEARVHLSMGELRVTVPPDINVEISNRVMLGEVNNRVRRSGDEKIPGAPTLTIAGSVTMGELRIERR